ncbi:MAG TPA: CDP-diacylglycerol--glycerol-3-phosphate 3-phosphatidyltransferase [Bryobacteraceae bacterium]|nr:CDP-diacylglycerol--glycerol-3-phosphate 3-phosphatidyltransferase [Bryobacteraceae bacterium]
MNLPNLLTIARIFFVPLLVAALVEENVSVHAFGLTVTNEWLALGIFLIAAATDLLDGYLARRWGQVTTIGTLLDPIADKLLISAALISLVQVHAVPAWMVILIVGREFAISGLRAIAAAEGYTIKASDLGKTKMVAQVTAISFLLVSIRHPAVAWFAYWMMWVVVLFAVASAIGYFGKFWRKVDVQIKLRRRRELLRIERRRKLAALRQGRAPASAGAVESSEVGGAGGVRGRM